MSSSKPAKTVEPKRKPGKKPRKPRKPQKSKSVEEYIRCQDGDIVQYKWCIDKRYNGRFIHIDIKTKEVKEYYECLFGLIDSPLSAGDRKKWLEKEGLSGE